MRRIYRHGLSDRVVFLGVIPETKLPSLYRGARALLFPSLYEDSACPYSRQWHAGPPL